MPMDDTQYSLLTQKIGFKKEGMRYLDFAAGFEGTEAKPWAPQPAGASAEMLSCPRPGLDSGLA